MNLSDEIKIEIMGAVLRQGTSTDMIKERYDVAVAALEGKAIGVDRQAIKKPAS